MPSHKNAKASDFVFPGSSQAGHLVGLPKMWERVATKAELKDVTLHGLRHWFASAATEVGLFGSGSSAHCSVMPRKASRAAMLPRQILLWWLRLTRSAWRLPWR